MITQLNNIEIIIETDSVVYMKDYSDFSEEFKAWCHKKNVNNPEVVDFENFLDEKEFDDFSIIDK